MMNSSYLQFGTAASRPAQGNKGVWHIATDTLELTYDNGSAWVSMGHIVQFTTKGDIIVFDGTKPVRLGVGSNDQAVIADSGEASGVKWGSGGLLANSADVMVEAMIYG